LVNERSERLAKNLKVPLLIATLLTLPVIVIEQRHARGPWKEAASIANWVIWWAFAFELQRFIAAEVELVEEEVAEGLHETDQMLAELREVMERLQRVEMSVQRLGRDERSTPSGGEIGRATH
jgi:hypothetical protein